MEPISNLFGQKVPVPPAKKSRRTERGDLIEYFMVEANRAREGTTFKPLPLGYFVRKLQHLNVKDLYYLKSVCELARRDGRSWSKTFWWEIKPRDESARAS